MNVCSITQSNGIDQYFLQKSNASFMPKGVESWKAMLYHFMDDTQSWLEHHHMRSISECVNSSMKRKMPTKIRKKLPRRKKTDETLKIIMQNLKQYNYLKHTKPEIIKNYRELEGK